MRLTSLTLEKYGPFANLELGLDPQKLNLLLAPNGAGKSVLRSAIHDLLFGIHGQTPMGFRFGYSGMRLAAEAVGPDGPLRFTRRKGHGNTLTDSGGGALDPARLTAMIGNFDSARFERLLALDSRLLRDGADALLKSGGDLYDALFAAAGSITPVRDLLRSLQDERDEIAPDRQVRAKPLYSTLDSWDSARKLQRDFAEVPQKRAETERLLLEAKDKRTELIKRETGLRAQHARLERVRRIRSPLRTIDAQSAVLQGIEPSIVALPADLAARWIDAKNALQRAFEKHDSCALALGKVDHEMSHLQIDQLVLSEGDNIVGLAREAIVTEADRRDLPKRELGLAQTSEKLQQIASDLGMAMQEDGGLALADPVLLAEAKRMVATWREIDSEQDRANREIASARDARARIEAELATLPEPIDSAPVEALVDEAMRNGAPTAVEQRLQSDLEAAEVALEAARAKVPGWTGSLDGLLALVPPPTEMSSTIARKLDEAHHVCDEKSKSCMELEARCADHLARLARLRAGEPLPDPATIRAARDRRDQGWALVRGLAFDRSMAREDSRLDDWQGPDVLPDTFEAAMSDADRLADKRDAEAERLAGVAQAESDLAGTEVQLVTARASLTTSETALATVLSNWAALLSRHGLPNDLTPIDTRTLVDSRAAVVDYAARRTQCREAVERERAAQNGLANRLLAVLRTPPAPLTQLLAAARAAVAEARTAENERRDLSGQLKSQARLVERKEREREVATAAEAKWRTDWAVVTRRIGRPPEESPEGTTQALQLIEEARRLLDERRNLDHRIAGMRRNIEAVEQAALSLVGRIGPDLMGKPATEVAQLLEERFKKATADEVRRKTLSDQKVNALRNLKDAESELTKAGASLSLIRQEIGADDDDAAVKRIEAAKEANRARDMITSAQEALAVAGDGLTLEVLREEVAAHATLDLDQSLASVDTELKDIGPERDAASAHIQKLTLEQEAQERDTKARDASADRMIAAARLARLSAEALRLDLAASILETALKRLRSTSNGGIAERIGRVFARLTGQAYTGLQLDEQNEQPVLHAMSRDGEHKRIDELSEGTRDQLFLAMRLALLADLAGRGPLPPLVADDFLQTFDDDRTSHSLTELAGFCEHSQVIVLTHHRHVIDLAGRLPPAKVHICDMQEAPAS